MGFAIFSAVFPFLPHAALATLGEGETTVETDRLALVAVRNQSVSSTGYRAHEIASRSVTVREYADQSGVVFAITWRGKHEPDLEPLLGSYYGDFKQASKAASKKRFRATRAETHGQRVIVRSFGHMGAVRGIAYAPALFPENVSPKEIQEEIQ